MSHIDVDYKKRCEDNFPSKEELIFGIAYVAVLIFAFTAICAVLFLDAVWL
jgi:hypothetical protein